MAAYPAAAHWLGRPVNAAWLVDTQTHVTASTNQPGPWHWDSHSSLVECHGGYAVYMATAGHNPLGPNELAAVAPHLASHHAASAACYGQAWPLNYPLGSKLYDQWACGCLQSYV